LTPLDYLISVMRDETAPRAVRMQAAAKAAPYVHPRLCAIEHAGAAGGPIQVEQPIDLAELKREERRSSGLCWSGGCHGRLSPSPAGRDGAVAARREA
jgi:hypothetical protein